MQISANSISVVDNVYLSTGEDARTSTVHSCLICWCPTPLVDLLMIVLLTSRYLAANQKDAEVLQRILTALGVESGRSSQVGQLSTPKSFDFSPSHRLFQLVAGGGGAAQTDLSVHVSDPLLAVQIVKKAGGQIVAGLTGEEITKVGFRVKLPSGAGVHIGALSAAPDAAELPGLSGSLNASDKRFAIVVARFNAFITERLLQGAFDGLVRSGARNNDITIVRVPGAFEIPSAARTLAETKKYDAILCIGCLLRGDTAHYDVIVNEVTRGIGQSAQETGVPHAFGVLTCDTLEQAIDRAGLKMGNKGLEAAMAAVEMANLQRVVANGGARRPSGTKSSKKKTPKKSPSGSHRKSRS